MFMDDADDDEKAEGRGVDDEDDHRPDESTLAWERTMQSRSGRSTPPDTAVAHIRELIEDESHVDLDKLAECARAGLPASVRGDVWKYLLGVAKADKSEEFTHERELYSAYRAVRSAALAAFVKDMQGMDHEPASAVCDSGAVSEAIITGAIDEGGLSEDPNSARHEARNASSDTVPPCSFRSARGERYASGRRSFDYVLASRPDQALMSAGGGSLSPLSLEQSANWDDALARRVRNEAKRRIERERLRTEHIRLRFEKRTSNAMYGHSPSGRNGFRGMALSNAVEHQTISLRNVDSETNLVNPAVVRGTAGHGNLSDGDDSVKVPSRPPSAPAHGIVLERAGLRQLEREEGNLCSSPESASSGTNSFRSGEFSGVMISGGSSTRSGKDEAHGMPAHGPLGDGDAVAFRKRPERSHEGGSTRTSGDGRPLPFSTRTPSALLIQCYVTVLCTYLYAVELSVRHIVALPLMAHWGTQLSPVNDPDSAHDTLTSLDAPVEYSPTLVSLLHVFVEVFSPARETDIYYAFCALMHRRGHICLFNVRGDGLTRATANFLMLFRTLLPDLADFFESEEIEHRRWLHGWLQGLFSRGEMPIENTLRLWDFYFASGLEMHTYVCLAVLDLLQDEITEMDGPEVVTFLGKLPDTLDPEQLLTRAVTIREAALGSGLVPSESVPESSTDIEKERGMASLCLANDS
ncbi:hypothetical protein CCYA_CCYA14G3664 [Cyanidiococcus yangmingshanensis]|nr:hypothetical protein CCYA_CCYA14G3664 [Cyanidiococcus yangmingshanensis]